MNLGNLGGLYPQEEDLGFNEAIASFHQQVNVAAGATVDIAIPFGFSSPAELDLVFAASDANARVRMCSAPGVPDGIFVRTEGAVAGNYFQFSLVGSAIRITAVGETCNGSLRVVRRNRRVKNWSRLTATAGAEAQLPFTISDPHKTVITGNSVTAIQASTCPFLGNFIPATDTNSWHFAPNFTTNTVRVTSPNTYVTQAAVAATIVEFE